MGEETIRFLIIILAYLGAFALIGLPFYIYLSVCLMFLAKKTETPGWWMAWIPILNIYLLCKIAGKSHWFVYHFLPIIIFLFSILFNLPAILEWAIILLGALVSLAIALMPIVLWGDIAEKLGKPRIWGILIIVPIVNLIIMGILAFSKRKIRDLN